MKRTQYKQIWYQIIKLIIVFGAGYYIYTRVFSDTKLDSSIFFSQLDDYLFRNWLLFLLLINMSFLNWLLEIKKWQTLASHVQPISFFQAIRQSLSSHTLSLITPLKAGEYGGKALYFPKNLHKSILLLNFIGNVAQLFATLLFGIVGLVYFLKSYDVKVNVYKIRRIGYLVAFLIASLFAGIKLGRKDKAGYYQKAVSFFNKMSWQTKRKTIVLSFLRYLVFSHQFYFLLILFGIDIPYETTMMFIFTMYFLATFLPVFSLFDFVIKGSIAIYLFSFYGVDEVKIITISTLMWILNFAIPAMLGSYFVLSYKPDFKAKFV